MAVVKIDKKWRIVLPKQVRNRARLRRSQHLKLTVQKNSIVLKTLRVHENEKEDAFINDITKNAAHVDPKKLKKIDLKKIEEEMWLP